MSKPLTLDAGTDELAAARREWEAMRDGGHLLKAVQVAEFVARGVLTFDQVVPDELNREALTAFAAEQVTGGGYVGDPLASRWPAEHVIARILALPRVHGILASLVGPQPRHDHHHTHIVRAGHLAAQGWHADAAIDPRDDAFDIQVMYYPHDVPVEMGGTMILPGSHLRQIHEGEAARYHHFVGQVPTVCRAGSIHVLHHGIWHRARGNATATTRYMFKVRLNPQWKQERLFDLEGCRSPEVGQILNRGEPWFGSDTRLEIINRVRLWRHLIGDPSYDSNLWLGRLEASPQRRLHG